MVDTEIIRLETGLVARDEFISGEVAKHFVTSKSFKYFTKNRKKRNWSITFNVLFAAFYVNGNNMAFFHLE